MLPLSCRTNLAGRYPIKGWPEYLDDVLQVGLRRVGDEVTVGEDDLAPGRHNAAGRGAGIAQLGRQHAIDEEVVQELQEAG